LKLENGKSELLFAGAYNPLWIIRKDTVDIEKIKGDKQPIGKFRNGSPFKTHKTFVQPGDTIYVFTDGYADQFGGKKNKKFKTVNLARLLVSIQEKEMFQQRQILESQFDEWKGTFEQIDDVCIVGLRIV